MRPHLGSRHSSQNQKKQIVDWLAQLLTNASALGLLFGGVGIIVLGVPAMLSTVSDIRKASGTAWGYNPELIRTNVFLRLDSGTGALFLVAEFILQLFGTLGLQLSFLTGAILFSALLVLSLAYALWFRRRLCAVWVRTISMQ